MTSPLITPDAPSGRSLLRSTLIALAVAAVVLVVCVLPAEYGVDPTGMGRVLGLTQMGEVKLALAEEAASNAAAEASADSVIAASESAAEAAAPSADGSAAALTPRADTALSTAPPPKSGEITPADAEMQRRRAHTRRAAPR